MEKDEVKSQAEWISGFRFVKCHQCDVDFASPLLNKRLDDGLTFYCPLGHAQYFPSGREKTQREELEKKRKLAEEEELYRLMHPLPKPEPAPEVEKKSFWRRE